MALSLSDLPPRAREQAIAKMAVAEAQRQSKYHAKKADGVLADGTPHTFDSRRELERYNALALLQRAGEISDLRIQVPYELIPKQKKADGKTERAVTYIADFVYKDRNGNEVVEDSKGVKTKEYVIKRKLMLYRYGITIREV